MGDYTGIILKTGQFSSELREYIQGVIHACSSMDQFKIPSIMYVAAWKKDRRRIWYEYVSPRLSRMLDCDQAEVAECMRHKVIDRREYHYIDTENVRIEEQVTTRQELIEARLDLRQQGVHRGGIEAIYKIGLESGAVWLKDQAFIRKFRSDDIYISTGCLTDVTKEMEQKELLEKIGYYDELTGLPRRTIMDRIMEINVGQFCRGHLEDFCFILMDIDHFKKINDRYGHQAGDYVLAAMAGIMSSAKRKEDELGRFGGEEFYGVCQGGIDTGVDFTERLRQLINSYRFTWEGACIEVRFSAGVVAANELKNVTEEAMIRRADQRLYMAKSMGRNQTVGSQFNPTCLRLKV